MELTILVAFQVLCLNFSFDWKGIHEYGDIYANDGSADQA